MIEYPWIRTRTDLFWYSISIPRVRTNNCMSSFVVVVTFVKEGKNRLS